MKKIIILVLVTFLLSCGVRKVEKNQETKQEKKENVIEQKNNLIVNETNNAIITKIIDSINDVVTEKEIFTPIDPNQSIVIIDESGQKKEFKNVVFTREKVKAKTSKKVNIKEDLKTQKITKDKGKISLKQIQKNKEIKTAKNVEKKYFSWWWIFLIILIIIIYYLWSKYKSFFI